MKIVLALLVILTATAAWAECNPMLCWTAGGECVDGKCVIGGAVPTPTPVPTQKPIINWPNDFIYLSVKNLFCNDRICIVVFEVPTIKGD